MNHENFFHRSIAFQSVEMINNIRGAFIGMVNESTWMDDVSKAKAIEKVVLQREKIDRYDDEHRLGPCDRSKDRLSRLFGQ